MKLSWLTFPALLAALALAVSACGGDSDVPEGAVAVVDGTEISREDLDELVERSRKNAEAQNQEFPKVGTPEYQNIQKQYVAFLVQREQLEQEAEERGLEVKDAEVDKEFSEFVKTNFQGNRKAFDEALQEQGFTLESFRETLSTSVLSKKLFDAVTKDIEVPDSEVVAYYQQNSAQYATAESRDVRHILVSEKNGAKVDYAASKAEADRILAEIRGGADFAALAKAESADTVSARDGGKLTITKGQTVAPFEKTSFALKEGEVSEPVKTTFGYHIIEALSPLRKATTTPLAKVKASIKSQLLQQKKSTFMTEWVQDLGDEYADKTSYALGFEPPELPEETSTDTETETTSSE